MFIHLTTHTFNTTHTQRSAAVCGDRLDEEGNAVEFSDRLYNDWSLHCEKVTQCPLLLLLLFLLSFLLS
jgi:hypothetical protein